MEDIKEFTEFKVEQYALAKVLLELYAEGLRDVLVVKRGADMKIRIPVDDLRKVVSSPNYDKPVEKIMLTASSEPLRTGTVAVDENRNYYSTDDILRNSERAVSLDILNGVGTHDTDRKE